MRRQHLLIEVIAALAALVAVAGPVQALTAGLGDDYFAAGASVELREVVFADALLAGGSVDSDAAIGGDATIAGGRVAVRATVAEDVHVAGGRVLVDALVGGKLRAAGGSVELSPETRIDGSAAIAGGNVSVAGGIGGNLTVVGGEVTLQGDVMGDVRVWARRLRVLPGTRIGGELRYSTSQPFTLPPGVVVGGGMARDDGGPPRGDEWLPPWDAEQTASRFGWIWLAGLFGVGVLLAFAFARFSRRTSRALTERPWLGLSLGLLVLVLMPATVVALVFTLVGIPLALILLLGYLAMLIAAYVIGALYLGDRALQRLAPGSTPKPFWRLLAFLLVLIGLSLLGGVPFIGDIARFAVLLLGLGGITIVAWGAGLEVTQGERATPA